MIIAAPFGSPGMVILDSLRLVMFLGGMSLVGALAWNALDHDRLRSPARRYSALAGSVALVVLTGSRLQNLGQPPSWQLFVSLVAFLLFGLAMETYRREDADR